MAYNNAHSANEKKICARWQSTTKLARWLRKAKKMQWDYKNIVKRRGHLEKIGEW